ncbi:MAG: hypothetical protein HW416_2801 [Chloroflexi bacterium]|nr:hypothetical protein [Chloroflexota bacterium]
MSGCVPTRGPGSSQGSAQPEAASEAGPPKTLVIGQPRAREGFGPWFIRGSGRILQYEELHTNALISTDDVGRYEARLAARIPSLDDGSITILPDGRMRMSWTLRPNVKWHDGAPLTAEDVVFGYQVSVHPEIPVQLSGQVSAMESIEPVDSHNLVMTYRSTFYRAVELGFRDLYVLPKHLLAAQFQGDKDAFTRLPYFSTEYVHTGPFRVSEVVLGESVVMERFDDYFRGRPKVHTIVLRFIGDDNAMVTNMLAGAVDIAGELADSLVVRLRDDWKETRAGFVVSQQGNWRFISIQFHPQWGSPPELQSDVRVRRALALGIDREAIAEAVVPGFPDTSADTFMVKGDALAATVGTPFARYRSDPAQAARDLEEAGWRRGADGRLTNAAGQPIRLDIRTTAAYEIELAAVGNDWRRLGFEVTEEVMSRALSQDREYIAKFPSAEISAQSNSDSIFRRFDSRGQPLPENRYVGSNGGHYVNPTLDTLIERLYSSIDARQQGELLKEMGELIATDLPALPMYFSVNTVAALRHVRALDDFAGAVRAGGTARNAHLWDRAAP